MHHTPPLEHSKYPTCPIQLSLPSVLLLHAVHHAVHIRAPSSHLPGRDLNANSISLRVACAATSLPTTSFRSERERPKVTLDGRIRLAAMRSKISEMDQARQLIQALTVDWFRNSTQSRLPTSFSSDSWLAWRPRWHRRSLSSEESSAFGVLASASFWPGTSMVVVHAPAPSKLCVTDRNVHELSS